jgi:1,4-dihydroxy-2-naphthoate polyprenyltransferase
MDDPSTGKLQPFGTMPGAGQGAASQRLAERVALWASAARVRTLPASVAPVLIGVVLAYADGLGHAPAAWAALLGAILIQVGTNYANDYFDFVKGADTAERQGPRRAVQSGLISPDAMRRATVLVFGLAVLVGLYLVARGGWPIVVVGVASILCGVLYTGGPYPLGYRGLGDLFVLLFFGPVAVAGTYWVQALELDWRPIVAGLGPGLISVAILAVNNLRDRETDAKAGKRTLAVRLGARFTRLEYTTAVLLACLCPLVFMAAGVAGVGMLLPLMTLLAAWPVHRTVWRRSDGTALNGALADTGRLLMLYAVLFCIGWLISAV